MNSTLILRKKLLVKLFFLVTMLTGPEVFFGQSVLCDSLTVEISEIQPITCVNGSDGALQASVQGGAEPYQIQWNTGDLSNELTGLSAGVYGASIVDANGCFSSGFFQLIEPEPTVLEITLTDANCGESNGSLSVVAPEENGPYNFALNGGDFQPEGEFSDLSPAVYIVHVQNVNGCTEQRFITINSTNSPELSVDQTSEIQCFEGCEAEIALVSTDEELFYTWYAIDSDGNSMQIAEDVTALSELCSGNYYACAEEVLIGGLPNPVTFWSEDFGSGCNQGQLANGYSGDNGGWSVTDTGTNQEFSNNFFVSATEQIGADNCGTACGGENNRTLHVSNVTILFIPADGGALYISDFATNRRAESPVIDCSSYENIELSFDYIEFGQGDLDNATLWYFDGNAWSLLDDMSKTVCCGGPCNGTNQGSFTAYSVQLPESANNNPNVRIGFNWTNNADSQGSDPSFAVDNIALTGVEEGIGEPFCSDCSNVFEVGEPEAIEILLLKFGNSSCFGNDDGTIQVQAIGGEGPFEYTWDHGVNTSFAENLSPGLYTVTVTDANGCEVSESYEIIEPEEELVDFEYTDMGLEVVFTNNSSAGDYLWDFGDGSQSDEANPTHSYSESGEYTVCLTLLSDCGDQTDCQDVNIVLTGVENMEGISFVELFPNPALNHIWIQPKTVGSFTIRFHNAAGQLVDVMAISGRRVIDVSNWEMGVYYYTIETSENEITRGKIVVSR